MNTALAVKQDPLKKLGLVSTPAIVAMKRVASIDFTMVKNKLMNKEEGSGWSKERVDDVESKYRHFLCTLLMSPEEKLAPSKEVDVFWHQHILDTRAYAKDCDRVFGYFLHHSPHVGMRRKETRRSVESSSIAMCLRD